MLSQWGDVCRTVLGLLGRRSLTRDTPLGKLLMDLACGGTSLNIAVDTALGLPIGPQTFTPEALSGSLVACAAATAMDGHQPISTPLAR